MRFVSRCNISMDFSVHSPSLQESGYFCNRIVFVRIGLMSTRTQWIRAPKPHNFETALQSGIFGIRRGFGEFLWTTETKFFENQLRLS